MIIRAGPRRDFLLYRRKKDKKYSGPDESQQQCLRGNGLVFSAANRVNGLRGFAEFADPPRDVVAESCASLARSQSKDVGAADQGSGAPRDAPHRAISISRLESQKAAIGRPLYPRWIFWKDRFHGSRPGASLTIAGGQVQPGTADPCGSGSSRVSRI